MESVLFILSPRSEHGYKSKFTVLLSAEFFFPLSRVRKHPLLIAFANRDDQTPTQCQLHQQGLWDLGCSAGHNDTIERSKDGLALVAIAIKKVGFESHLLQ